MALQAIQSFFSGNPLDRADHLRKEPTTMSDMLQSADSRFMLLLKGEILSDPVGGIYWLSHRQCAYLPLGTTVFLGLSDGAPRYAANLDGAAAEFDGLFPDAKFRDARALGMKAGFAHPELGIVAQAKSMLSWHSSHRFCAKCGAESALSKAGYERLCPTCDARHFPRTDPVVIMLALNGDEALVGRGPQLPPGYFSALAGFMEPGETIEEAVARELMEEAGVTATSVEIIANQPWPWPSSLMIGCTATVTSKALTLDDTEIDEARWITREEAKNALLGGSSDFMVPPPIAIAHDLLKHWVENTISSSSQIT